MRRPVILLTASAIFAVVPFSLIGPLSALKLKAAGLDEASIGGLASITWIVILFSPFFVPQTMKKLGVLRANRAAAFLCVITSALLAVSFSAVTVAISNLLLGAAAAVRWILTESMAADLAPDGKKGRFIGAYETFLGAAFALGPMLIPLTGERGPGGFYLATVLYFLSWLGSLGVGETPSIKDAGGGKPAGTLWGFTRERPLTCGLALAGGFFESGAIVSATVYGLDIGLSPAAAGMLAGAIGTGSCLAQYPVGHSADYWPYRRVARGFLVFLVLAPLGLFFDAARAVWIWPAAFLWGGLGGGLYTLSMAKMGQTFKSGKLVVATSAVVTYYTLGAVLGPALGGLAIRFWPFAGFPTLLFAAAAAALIFSLRRSE
jgi:MFS family permease